jgi:hypothetical protein
MQEKIYTKYSDTGRRSFVLLGLCFILGLSFLLCFALWPFLIEKSFFSRMNPEFNILVIVVTASSLGSTVSAINSLLRQGNDNITQKQNLILYLTRILLGIPLGLFSYFFIRGIILSPSAGLLELNRFGLAFMSLFAGMFESILMGKLGDVFQTAFGKPNTLEKQVDIIGNLLGAQVLTNYQGFLFINIPGTYRNPNLSEATFKVQLGRVYRLSLQFRPTLDENISMEQVENARMEKIQITGGKDEGRVEFTVSLNGRNVRTYSTDKTISFQHDQFSDMMDFDFEMRNSPEDGELWIEISQKNRVIAVIPTFLYTVPQVIGSNG